MYGYSLTYLNGLNGYGLINKFTVCFEGGDLKSSLEIVCYDENLNKSQQKKKYMFKTGTVKLLI